MTTRPRGTARYACQRCLKPLHHIAISNGQDICYPCRNAMQSGLRAAVQRELGRHVGEVMWRVLA